MTRAWLLVLACGGLALPLRAQSPEGGPITLFRAIELAQEHGLGGRAAASAYEAAQWRDREFGARLLPRISLRGETPSLLRRIEPVTQPDGQVRFVARSQTQASLTLDVSQELPFTGGQLYVSSSLTRMDLSGEGETHFWQSSPLVVGLRQELFRPNALAWDTRERRLGSAIADRQYLEAREDVAVATVGAFFDAYIAKMTLDNLAKNVAVNDTLFRLNRGRYEVGKIGENDLLQSELALLRARAELDGARLAYERAHAGLRLQLGLPPGEPLEIVAPTEIVELSVDTASAVAAALRNRSAILGHELQELQARRRVREAQLDAGIGATVTAEVGYNQTATTFGNAYQSLLGQQRFALGVEVPLVQWGAGKARIEAARADEERMESTTRLQREETAQEAHFAALELEQTRRRVVLSAKADTVAAKRFEVAMNRYLIGKIGVDNLFMAQSEKDGALQAYIQSLRGYWAAYYRLRRLTLYDFAAGREIG